MRRKLKIQAVGPVEEPEPWNPRWPGPKDLPFDHDDVRIFVDNLFTDGMLTPISGVPPALVQGSWVSVGLTGEGAADHLARLRKLLQSLGADTPPLASDHQAWVRLAARWAEAVALRWSLSVETSVEDRERFDTAHLSIEGSFQKWMVAHFSSLHSLSFLPRPAMIHQIPLHIAHQLAANSGGSRHALLVVDGLAMDQWVVARQEMPPRSWVMEELGLFAWVPTLTSVCRQSIFAGETPFFFASSLTGAHKEEQHWRRFWENHGLRKDEVAYSCQGALEDDDDFIAGVEEVVDRKNCRIVGIVVGTVDQMLHGTITGTDGMHASVRHWAKRGSLWRLLDALIRRGFDVVLTADHGNVGAVGVGKPNVGVTAQGRGQRVHVFSDSLLRANVGASYPGSISWPSIGLPVDYLSLIAPALGAFIGEGRRTVAHGGICIEEAIVPFVTITRPA